MQQRTTERGWREPLPHPDFEHGISGMIDIFVLLHGIPEDCHTENQRNQGITCDKLIDDRISSPHLASSGFCSNPAPSAGRSIIISDQWYNSHDQWCSCPTYQTSIESYVIVMLGMFLQSHYLQFSWFGSGSIIHTICSPTVLNGLVVFKTSLCTPIENTIIIIASWDKKW